MKDYTTNSYTSCDYLNENVVSISVFKSVISYFPHCLKAKEPLGNHRLIIKRKNRKEKKEF